MPQGEGENVKKETELTLIILITFWISIFIMLGILSLSDYLIFGYMSKTTIPFAVAVVCGIGFNIIAVEIYNIKQQLKK